RIKAGRAPKRSAPLAASPDHRSPRLVAGGGVVVSERLRMTAGNVGELMQRDPNDARLVVRKRVHDDVRIAPRADQQIGPVAEPDIAIRDLPGDQGLPDTDARSAAIGLDDEPAGALVLGPRHKL